jgi:hypothetical protein
MQGTGYFRMSLPAGTYTLNAESIATNFNGGSSVGPYSDTATEASFLPPHPITPVALGGAAPLQIAISAGCAATAVFHLDGAGNVTGNCTGAPAPLPPLIALTRNGSGSGTVSWAPVNGTNNVTLTATPAGGSAFMGWLGACTGKGPCIVDSSVAAGVSATFAPNSVLPRVDVDGDGIYNALTDGMLIMRHLSGLTGDGLYRGVVGSAAARGTPAALAQQLENIKPLLDVDGNGQVDAMTDGMAIMRYMFGFRGAALIDTTVGQRATRVAAPAIEAYIRTLMP